MPSAYPNCALRTTNLPFLDFLLLELELDDEEELGEHFEDEESLAASFAAPSSKAKSVVSSFAAFCNVPFASKIDERIFAAFASAPYRTNLHAVTRPEHKMFADVSLENHAIKELFAKKIW